MISHADQKPACLLIPTVLNTRHEPVLGNIVENSAYTNAVGSTASVISANARNVPGPVYDMNIPSQ